MAPASQLRERAAETDRRYRRVLVPLVPGEEAARALQVACALAAERGSITALTVIEVPPLLPLDAFLDEEERAARALLERAEAAIEAHGLRARLNRVRAREAAAAILEAAGGEAVDLVVLGAARRKRARRLAPPFGRTVQHVLRKAACRVLVLAAPSSG